MTPDQYRSEGAEAMREAAAIEAENCDICDQCSECFVAAEAIRAIDVDEVLAKVEVGDAPFTALSKFASKAAADVARWKARAEAAEAERDRMREALTPFGEAADYLGSTDHDHEIAYDLVFSGGDLRRARFALNASSHGGGA